MDFEPDLRNTRWINGWRNMPEAYVRVKTPGVTTIINDMLPNPEIEEWIKSVGVETANRITQAANYRGTAMHLFIELFLKKIKECGDPSASLKEAQIEAPPILQKDGIPQYKIDEGRNLFYKFLESDYISDHEKIIGTELNIYSPILFYRGKIDWTFIIKSWGIGIRDFKTSSKIIEKNSRKEIGYKYQLGAYAMGLDHMYKTENKDVKIKYASIISVHTKSNIVQNIECLGDELESYKEKFKAIAEAWHIKNGQEFLIKKPVFK